MFITTYLSCTSPQDREREGTPRCLAWPTYLTHHEGLLRLPAAFWLGSLHEPTHRSNPSVHRVFYPKACVLPPLPASWFAPCVSLMNACLWVGSSEAVVCLFVLGGREERL